MVRKIGIAEKRNYNFSVKLQYKKDVIFVLTIDFYDVYKIWTEVDSTEYKFWVRILCSIQIITNHLYAQRSDFFSPLL